jgi:hypothetical protein
MASINLMVRASFKVGALGNCDSLGDRDRVTPISGISFRG